MSVADGREQLLLKSNTTFDTEYDGLRTTDWTRDGRFVVYDSERNIMALPLDNTVAPTAVAASAADERGGKVSPDGRWIAYQSRDSGEWFIYVQPFPGPGWRTRLSVGAGLHPQWRADGAELFWGARLPRDVETSTTARTTRPQPTGNGFCYGSLTGCPGPVVKVILNWKEQLMVP